MGDQLNSLLGSGISLISREDVRYDGILFSINAAESQIVLQQGKPPKAISEEFSTPFIFHIR